MYTPEYMLWNGRLFDELELAESSGYTMELAEQLLDHYMVREGKTYEFCIPCWMQIGRKYCFS